LPQGDLLLAFGARDRDKPELLGECGEDEGEEGDRCVLGPRELWWSPSEQDKVRTATRCLAGARRSLHALFRAAHPNGHAASPVAMPDRRDVASMGTGAIHARHGRACSRVRRTKRATFSSWARRAVLERSMPGRELCCMKGCRATLGP